MNVKKFEARSMKEALEMVKTQLGPDAVILSAKEVNKGFGLGGVKSIEITAAYSELVLKQKNYAQSKMPQATQDKFNRIPAKNQKDVIKKVIQSQNEKILRNSPMATQVLNKQTQNSTQTIQNQKPRTEISQRRYIDIDADQLPQTMSPTRPTPSSLKNDGHQNILTEQAKNVWNNMDVQKLKSEIESLKQIVLDFKSMPQTFVQSHPGAELGVNYDLCQEFQKLLNKGFFPQAAAEVILFIQQILSPHDLKNQRKIDVAIAQALSQKIDIQSEIKSQFQFFYGPSGSGKTTSLVKMASHLIKNEHKRVAIVSTDTIKIGADEQMKVYSQMLEIPFITIKAQEDWKKIQPYLNQIDFILVDFASMNIRNNDEVNYLLQMAPYFATSAQSHLVLSAKMKDTDILNCTEKYKSLHIDDYIVTALDEVQNYGTICNLGLLTDKPLFAFGLGSHIPEDFEFATIERVIDLILEITKNNQTLEAVL